MDEISLTKALQGLRLGGVRYFDSAGSTNDVARDWSAAGAPDMAVVVADEQTAGRGRHGRHWFTPKGTALACSVVLRPTAQHQDQLSRTVGLLALAVAGALQQSSLPAKIKWPNDVLVDGRKIAGILVESLWLGENLDCQVAGFGVNVHTGAVPAGANLDFPATSIEELLGRAPAREDLLRLMLSSLIELRARMHDETFITEWESNLAFRDEMVRVQDAAGSVVEGRVLGLDLDGALRILLGNGRRASIQAGEIRLRPAA